MPMAGHNIRTIQSNSTKISLKFFMVPEHTSLILFCSSVQDYQDILPMSQWWGAHLCSNKLRTVFSDCGVFSASNTQENDRTGGLLI